MRRRERAVRRSLSSDDRYATWSRQDGRHTNGGLPHTAPDTARSAVEFAQYADRPWVCLVVAHLAAARAWAVCGAVEPRPGISVSDPTRVWSDHVWSSDHQRHP